MGLAWGGFLDMFRLEWKFGGWVTLGLSLTMSEIIIVTAFQHLLF